MKRIRVRFSVYEESSKCVERMRPGVAEQIAAGSPERSSWKSRLAGRENRTALARYQGNLHKVMGPCRPLLTFVGRRMGMVAERLRLV